MRISKYHSCENTFLIMMDQKGINYSYLANKLCNDEDFNSDGLLVLKTDPIEVLIFNKDGSQANMCGNGLNCMMHYCYDKFKIYKYLRFKTKAGIYECEMLKKTPFSSCVNLGIGDYYKNIIKEKLKIKDKEYEITSFLLGVWHIVVVVNDLDESVLDVVEIFNHPLFDKKANINLVKIISDDTVEMITYERGVGFTKACGSGAGATAYILHEHYGLNNKIKLLMPGGILDVEILDNIYLTGESTFLKESEFEI